MVISFGRQRQCHLNPPTLHLSSIFPRTVSFRLQIPLSELCPAPLCLSVRGVDPSKGDGPPHIPGHRTPLPPQNSGRVPLQKAFGVGWVLGGGTEAAVPICIGSLVLTSWCSISKQLAHGSLGECGLCSPRFRCTLL
jgi:hypothetical protein